MKLPSRNRLPSLRKVALWGAGLLALFAVVGFLIVPPIAKSIVISQAGKALGREVQIDRLAVNPFALSATVEGFRLYEQGSKDVFASVEQLYVNVEASSVWNLAPVIGALTVTRPQVKVVRLDEKRFNFTDIVETLAKQPKSEKKAYFSLNNIELIDGRVDIDDRLEQAQHAVTGMRLAVPFISNLPAKVDIKVTPAFAAKFNETQIDLKGETVPFKDTMESSLQVTLADIRPGRYLRYVPMKLGFEMPSGALSTDLRVSFIQAKGVPHRLTVSGLAKLSDLSIVDLNKAPLVALPLLELDLESLDVFGRSVDVSRVTINGLAIDAVREQDGRINLLSLVPQPERTAAAPAAPSGTGAAPAPAPRPFRFAIADFALVDGKVRLTDRMLAPAFRAELADVDIGVKGLSNAQDATAQVTAQVRTALGETVKSQASFGLSPMAAEGTVELAGLRPRNYAPYYAPLVRVELDDAKIDASTGFNVAAAGDTLAATLTGLALSVTDLRTRRAGEKEPLLNIKTLAINGVDLDLAKRTASVGEFITRDGLLRVDREKNGQINLASLMAPPPPGGRPSSTPAASITEPAPVNQDPAPSAAGPVRATAEPMPPWTWSLKRAEVERWNVKFSDRLPEDPVAIDVTGISASVSDLTSSKGSRAKLALKLGINRSGTLVAKGQAGFNPPVAAIDFDARSIEVLPLQPYFTDRLNILITGGDVSAKGSVNADASAQPVRAGFAGEVNIANFAALERTNNEELLRWKSLFFGGIDVKTSPMQLTVAEIALSDFFARMILSQKGRLNLQDIVKREVPAGAAAANAAPAPTTSTTSGTTTTTTTTATTTSPPASNAPLAPFPIRIGRISIASGNINYSDFFVKPNYRVNLTGMTGAVSSLTSEPGTAADIELRGQLDGTAPVEVLGRLNPITNPLFVDIRAAIRGAELSTLSPYTLKYTGYGIERGRLTLNTSYKVEGRKLEAQHRIFLDQLTFSTDRVEGPEVIKLPILFAVRLLQNSRGEIDLNLPIGGTLDDPKFRLGPIIWQVVVNLITRAVTAPFSLLASLVGGGNGEELSYVEFEPGRATLTETAQKRLATLGKALGDRPSLRLELSGGVDVDSDRDGARRVQLEQAVRAQKARELARQGESVAAIDALKLDPKEYETYLRAVYRDAKFPKPRNAIGLQRDLPVQEMETLILTNTEITNDDLRELALARSRAVEAYFEKTVGLSSERVFLVTAKPGSAGEKAMASAARVDMTIR